MKKARRTNRLTGIARLKHENGLLRRDYVQLQNTHTTALRERDEYDADRVRLAGELKKTEDRCSSLRDQVDRMRSRFRHEMLDAELRAARFSGYVDRIREVELAAQPRSETLTTSETVHKEAAPAFSPCAPLMNADNFSTVDMAAGRALTERPKHWLDL